MRCPGSPNTATTIELGEAFYNPHTTLDRDLTIASLAAFDRTVYHLESYLNTFAATGIRDLHAASEIGLATTLIDPDPGRDATSPAARDTSHHPP